jgi:hypothetical protein
MDGTSGHGGVAAQDWAELQEPTALPLWEAMLDVALVGPGARLLDAGCGAGAPVCWPRSAAPRSMAVSARRGCTPSPASG